MIRIGADWVVPIDRPPVHHGWVALDANRIVAVGADGDAGGERFGPLRRLEQTVLMPGLVNAHVHLELSWLRNRVPPAGAFTTWVKHLVAARGRTAEDAHNPMVQLAAHEAAQEARDSGTAAVGDVSNSLAVIPALTANHLRALVFHELIGFRDTTGAAAERSRAARARAAGADPGVRVTVAPHAPYSVSAELFQAIRAEISAGPEPYTTVHVGESAEEMELLATGSGEWERMLRWLGAWRDDWVAPGAGPVEHLDRLGFIDNRTVCVHGVQLSDASLVRLRELEATLVTCPRSNQWVGVGPPPIERFYQSGVAVAVGTDSLASVSDLNLFSELKEMRRLAPGVPARRLIESATLVGARALGLDALLGSLSPGKQAEIVAVSLPQDTLDVEEFLVSGVPARAVSWAHQAHA